MGSLRGEVLINSSWGEVWGGGRRQLSPLPNIRHAAHILSFVKIDQNMLEYVLRHPKISMLRTWTSENHQQIQAFGYRGNAIRSKMTFRIHF